MTPEYPRIAFIGAGNMAGSLIDGLLKSGYPTDRIMGCAPSQATRDRLREQFAINTEADNRAAAQSADVVVLGVKPQVMAPVCSELQGAIDHKPLIISVAAGISTELIDGWLGGDMAVVRCMPNTPSQLHCGASGLYANDAVSDNQRAFSERFCRAVGMVEWIADESLMDAVTALSGSGPAYYFLLMELMEKCAVELGLPESVARNLTVQTALGASRMAAEGELDPAELRRRVTSKKGTTDRAITTFLNEGLEDIIRKGMTGARDRGLELAAEMSANSDQ